MALATRCPSCQAMFRVVADQLKLRGGLVRCGTCRQVFDAIGSLTYVDDATVASAPIQPTLAAKPSAPPRAVPQTTPQPTPHAAQQPAPKPAPKSNQTATPHTPAEHKSAPKRDSARPITLRITPTSPSSVFGQTDRNEPRLAKSPPPPPPPLPPKRREPLDTGPAERTATPPEAGVPTLWMTEDELATGINAALPISKHSSFEDQRATATEQLTPTPAPTPLPAKRHELKHRLTGKPATPPAHAPTTPPAAPSAEENSGTSTTQAAASDGDDETQAAEEDAPAFLRRSEDAKGFSIVFAVGTALLALVGIVQLLVIFRTELVTHWPATRPTLIQACNWMGCTVGWPTRAELLAVVGTELQSVPGTDVLELTAVIRNRANYRVALPAVEVTLTDTQNRPVARKVFAPIDYLSSSGEPSSRIDEGLGTGADLTVKLVFEARGLAAAGFVVYPFYL